MYLVSTMSVGTMASSKCEGPVLKKILITYLGDL